MLRYAMYLKRCFDAVGAFIGLVLTLPMMVALAVLIPLTSRGPVFYTQNRVGLHGNLFRVVKFRSMYLAADMLGSITTASDARITPLGALLRKYKLDELPQLWNILLGRMSFVGPRPDVPGYADRLQGADRSILELRPGLTGPATLYFRQEEQLLASVDNPKDYNDQVIYPMKIKLNRKYMETWSFWRDLGYILVTAAPTLDRWLRLVPQDPFPTDLLSYQHVEDDRCRS